MAAPFCLVAASEESRELISRTIAGINDWFVTLTGAVEICYTFSAGGGKGIAEYCCFKNIMFCYCYFNQLFRLCALKHFVVVGGTLFARVGFMFKCACGRAAEARTRAKMCAGTEAGCPLAKCRAC